LFAVETQRIGGFDPEQRTTLGAGERARWESESESELSSRRVRA
jgi:hypothetical protein